MSDYMRDKKLKTNNPNMEKNIYYKLYLMEKQNNQKDIKIHILLFEKFFSSLMHIKYSSRLIISKYNI